MKSTVEWYSWATVMFRLLSPRAPIPTAHMIQEQAKGKQPNVTSANYWSNTNTCIMPIYIIWYIQLYVYYYFAMMHKTSSSLMCCPILRYEHQRVCSNSHTKHCQTPHFLFVEHRRYRSKGSHVASTKPHSRNQCWCSGRLVLESRRQGLHSLVVSGQAMNTAFH